jgi:hypothetical protein
MTSPIAPCKCGQTPEPKQSIQYGIRILRLECACGRHGATLMYTKPEDAAKIGQAAIDGWNLADHGSGQNHTSRDDQ